MAKTVIGIFQDIGRSQGVIRDLEDAGFARGSISLVALEQGKGRTKNGKAAPSAGMMTGTKTIDAPGIGPILAMGPLCDQLGGPEGLVMGLTKLGVPEHDARLYQQHLQQAHPLVEVRAPDDRADEAARIMSRTGALPLEGAAATGQTTPRQQPAKAPMAGRAAKGEIREPVIQEEIQVGKREVDRGGVRVFTHISEQPVQENVTLRQEHIDVERRPVDRPATAADLNRPAQEEVVMREKGEEPVIAKQARVVEEVVVSKQTQEQNQTIRDTVRRKDVDVEQVPGRTAGGQAGPSGGASTGDFARYESDFRGHSQSAFAGRGQGYEQVSPAYRYGFQLAGDERYRGRNWDTIRDQARTDWEQRSPGTWDHIEPAIRYAYEKVRVR